LVNRESRHQPAVPPPAGEGSTRGNFPTGLRGGADLEGAEADGFHGAPHELHVDLRAVPAAARSLLEWGGTRGFLAAPGPMQDKKATQGKRGPQRQAPGGQGGGWGGAQRVVDVHELWNPAPPQTVAEALYSGEKIKHNIINYIM